MKLVTVLSVAMLIASVARGDLINQVGTNTYSWQVAKADFDVFYKTAAQIKIVPTKFDKDGGIACDERVGAVGIAQPLKEIIQIAYGKDKLRTLTSTELPTTKYDFFAKLPGKNPVAPTRWADAFQQKIKNQFGLVGEFELKVTPVLVLKLKPENIRKLEQSHAMPNGIAFTEQSGQFFCFEQPISTLDNFLERYFKTPIVDRTGLTNNYDYKITWDEPVPDKPNPAGLKQALLDQLGLELVSTNEPIEMLVIKKLP